MGLWPCRGDVTVEKVKVTHSYPTLYRPWNSPGQNTGVGSLYLLQGIFLTQRLNPNLSHCWQIFFFFFLPFEPQGKPKNTGVLSPSLLQQIFLTQKLNLGLLHCRRFFITELSGKPITAYQDIDELPASLLKMHEFTYKEISENLQSYSKFFRFMFHLIILEW